MKNKIKINYFRLVIYLLFVSVICFFIFFNPRSALIIALIALIVLFLPSFLLIFRKVKIPDINLYMKNTSQPRFESNSLITKITSKSFFPFTKIVAKYELYHANEKDNKHYFVVNYNVFRDEKEYVYNLSFDYCGIYMIKASEIKFYDFLGIVYISAESNQCHAVITPIKLDHKFSDNRISLNLDEEDKNDPTKGYDVSEIRELREYRDGDKLSQVHWKLSTKSEDLIVKEYERLAGSCIVIGIDGNASSLYQLNQYYDLLLSFGYYILDSDVYFDFVYYSNKEEALIKRNITNTYDFNQAIENMLFDIQKTDINELKEYYHENFGKSKLFILSSTECSEYEFLQVDKVLDIYLYAER